ncbi:hypothetical protein H5410_003661 [Solanum commersonii]|uniref:Uncharacterized protein n=1 Tax=Solanum commersonii TaxID=4109 RepID=A0A9J6B5M3_SOLCO|nr:hypothetical protein H5410_003661 [Solanum commersonii]
MDTTSQKGMKRLKRMNVLNPEGKDQVGGRKEQSAHCREVLRSSTMSPNDPEHDNAEGWCKMAMNYSKGQIVELIGKAWTLLSKKEQKQLKERRNEDLRIVEPIRRVAKRSYPHLLFQCAEP